MTLQKIPDKVNKNDYIMLIGTRMPEQAIIKSLTCGYK